MVEKHFSINDIRFVIRSIRPKQFKLLAKKIFDIENKTLFYKALRYDKDWFFKTVNGTSLNLVVLNCKTGRLIGYLHAFPDDESFYLCGVGILKDFQGLGIGTKLMQLYIVKGIEKGFKSFRLHTINPAMIDIAKKFGFKVIKYYAKSISDKTEVLMELIV